MNSGRPDWPDPVDKSPTIIARVRLSPGAAVHFPGAEAQPMGRKFHFQAPDRSPRRSALNTSTITSNLSYNDSERPKPPVCFTVPFRTSCIFVKDPINLHSRTILDPRNIGWLFATACQTCGLPCLQPVRLHDRRLHRLQRRHPLLLMHNAWRDQMDSSEQYQTVIIPKASHRRVFIGMRGGVVSGARDG